MFKGSLYEISSLLQDKEQARKDMEDFRNYIGERVNERYLKQILRAADNEKSFVRKNPSKEIQLLCAMKNFSSNPKQIDSLIEMFNFMAIIGNMQREYAEILDENSAKNQIKDKKQSLIASEDSKDENINAEGLKKAQILLSLALLGARK